MRYAKIDGYSDVLAKTTNDEWLVTYNYPSNIENYRKYILNPKTKEWLSKKNLIPYPYDGHTINLGVQYNVREDGGIEINGTPTNPVIGKSYFMLYQGKPLVTEGKVTLSLQGTFTNTVCRMTLYDNYGFILRIPTTDSSITIDMNEFTNVVRMEIVVCNNDGNEMTGIVYPQLEVGEQATEYQPMDNYMQVLLFGDTVEDTKLDNNDTNLSNALIALYHKFIESSERMVNYYPDVIKQIMEFQSIVGSEGYEIDGVRTTADRVRNDAYLLTMGEDRIEQWENILGIKPIDGSSVSDRRDTVIARIRGQGKLNTSLINSIVNAFTGGEANSWIADGTLYVEITPPRNNKQYQFDNVEQELRLKVPAHLGFQVSRSYYEWGEVMAKHPTWRDVYYDAIQWENIYLFSPF